jgi:mono/diheme cytochrome c family protein
MLSRNLKPLIVAAFCGGLVLFVARGAAQRKTDEEPPLNADTTHLIESMDGAALYKAYCATCHGTDGKGIGPMTEWLKIKAPDLTRLSVREGGRFPFARVQRVIAGTENITKGHGTREMPIWGPVFSQVGRDQDLGQMRIYNLAEYIEKIQVR